MDAAGNRPPRLLIVEGDPEIRAVLSLLLEEEGYRVQGAASLDEALRLIDEVPFQGILADLFGVHLKESLAAATRLRKRAMPTPIGLMSTQALAEDALKHQGFAFFSPKPFEVEQLLADVAASLQQPLTPEQQRQAGVVQRFFESLDVRNWDALLALCTDDLTSYPPRTPAFAAARELRQKAAHRVFMQQLFESPRLKDARCEDIHIYARPKGLAARYQNVWREPDGSVRRLIAVMLFHFRGELISQIGVRTNDERLRVLLGQATPPRPFPST